ncbi:hypothetical protein [Leifsonia shinshuensis]
MTEKRQLVTEESEAARLLIELGSFDHDLGEAERAFVRAQDLLPDDPALAALVTDAGVVAYGRCFHKSGRRQKLDDLIAIPAQYQGTHDSVMHMRNRTVAHSESAQQVTLPVVELERDANGTINPTRALAMTIRHPVPNSFAPRALTLIKEIRALLAQTLAQTRADVVAEVDPTDLWTNGRPPQLVPTTAEWDAGARRDRFPTGAEIPVHLPDLLQ